jgi:hypothetical protein
VTPPVAASPINDVELWYARRITPREEGFSSYVYDDGTGIPTIGYGYSLVRRDEDGVYHVLGDEQLKADGLGALSLPDRQRLEDVAGL